MNQVTIEGAYAPFIAALREGGFLDPEEGWPAELVAAHIALNNELIAETAERIVAGERPTYENRSVNDDAVLRSHADSVGGLEGLADAVGASARRLARAWSALDAATEGYELPVVILDSDVVVREGPIPIRRFIEGNASFHLDLHFAQLQALKP